MSIKSVPIMIMYSTCLVCIPLDWATCLIALLTTRPAGDRPPNLNVYSNSRDFMNGGWFLPRWASESRVVKVQRVATSHW